MAWVSRENTRVIMALLTMMMVAGAGSANDPSSVHNMDQALIDTSLRQNEPDPPADGAATPPTGADTPPTVPPVTHTPALTKATNCYPNQFIDAGRIYQHFCNGGSHYATFIAALQSGKTGTYLELAVQMLRQKKVDKVYIISGCCEIELRDQLKRDINKCIRTYSDEELHAALDTSNETALQMLRQNKLEKLVSQQVEIIWGDNLGTRDLTEAERHQTKLIIWDECHYAEHHDNRPALWWKRNGIYNLLHVSTDDIAADPVLNSTYLLTVSATPSAQLFNDNKRTAVPESSTESTTDSDVEATDATGAVLSPEELQHLRAATQRHPQVVYTPSEAYYGVRRYLKNGQIEEAPTIGSTQFCDRFVTPFINQRKWLVIRVNNTKNKKEQHTYLENLSNEAQLGDVQYYDRSKRANFELSDFEQPPERTTIVVIDGLLRMGHVLPKTHVGAVMETATSSNATTILQGLLGRMCGYPGEDDWSDKKIFVPQKVISEINAYAANIKAIVSSTTMKVQTSREKKCEFHPTVPFVLTPQMLNEFDSSADGPVNDDIEFALGDAILDLVNGESNRTDFIGLMPRVAGIILQKSDQLMTKQRDNAQTFLQQVRTFHEEALQKREHATEPALRLFQNRNGKDSYDVEFPKVWKSVDDPDEYCTMQNNYYFRTDRGKPYTPYPFVMGVVFPGYSLLNDCEGLEAGSLIIQGCTDIGQTMNVPRRIIHAESKTGSEVWNPDGHGQDDRTSAGGGGGGSSSGRGTKRPATDEPEPDFDRMGGGLTIELPQDTRTNPVRMQIELRKQIQLIKGSGQPQCIRNILFNKAAFGWVNWRKTRRGAITDICTNLEQDESVVLVVHPSLKNLPAYKRTPNKHRRKFTQSWKNGVKPTTDEAHIFALEVIPPTPPVAPAPPVPVAPINVAPINAPVPMQLDHGLDAQPTSPLMLGAPSTE
jgi:hypothetical protein